MRFLGFLKRAHLSKEELGFSVSLENMLGFRPNNLAVYKKAFAHSSMQITDASGDSINNERLEFLGDAVLGSIVAGFLFVEFPKRDEGFLTSMRSKIVSRTQLNKLAIKLGVHSFLESNLQENSRSKSLYGDALEAIVGAIYLDKGFEYSRMFILEKMIAQFLVLPEIEEQVASYKSRLIEWSQKSKIVINFRVIETIGEQHNLTYNVEIFINNESIGGGIGRSKKMAEESASKAVCENLNLV
ncbi:MAG: ribonuclease-3 [Flavobacteriales bacterium]|jgi:ribonuclease-3